MSHIEKFPRVIRCLVVANDPHLDRQRSDHLLYYDAKGDRRETTVSLDAMKEILRVFEPGIKGVRRSSGGVGIAEPFQLILYETEDESTPPTTNYRIRVRLKDFAHQPDGKFSVEYQSHTKIVVPQDIVGPWDFGNTMPETFVIDFGAGIIPVCVFHYETDEKGNAWAWFVEPHELETAPRSDADAGKEIQPYRALRDVLRLASPIDLRDAEGRRQQMRRAYLRSVPQALRLGSAQSFSRSIPSVDIFSQLQRLYHSRPGELVSPANLTPRLELELSRAESRGSK